MTWGLMYTVPLKYELDRHSRDIGRMQIPLAYLSQFNISCSIEYFWEDALAIKSTILPEDYASKQGLWTNNKFRGEYLV